MPNCRYCKYAKYKLKCLICEQADEINAEKYKLKQHREVIKRDDTPFPWLLGKKKTAWILSEYCNMPTTTIGKILSTHPKTITRWIVKIKKKYPS